MPDVQVYSTHKSMIHAQCPTGLQAWDYYEIEATFARFQKAEEFESQLNAYRLHPPKMLQEELAQHILVELRAEKIVLTGRHGRTTTRVEAFTE